MLNAVRAGDTGLGNRCPNELGGSYKACPWCITLGLPVKLDEEHVLLCCPSIGYDRQVKGLNMYRDIKLNNSRTLTNVLEQYILSNPKIVINGFSFRSSYYYYYNLIEKKILKKFHRFCY